MCPRKTTISTFWHEAFFSYWRNVQQNKCHLVSKATYMHPNAYKAIAPRSCCLKCIIYNFYCNKNLNLDCFISFVRFPKCVCVFFFMCSSYCFAKCSLCCSHNSQCVWTHVPNIFTFNTMFLIQRLTLLTYIGEANVNAIHSVFKIDIVFFFFNWRFFFVIAHHPNFFKFFWKIKNNNQPLDTHITNLIEITLQVYPLIHVSLRLTSFKMLIHLQQILWFPYFSFMFQFFFSPRMTHHLFTPPYYLTI